MIVIVPRSGIYHYRVFPSSQKPNHLLDLTWSQLLCQAGHALVALAFAMSNDGAYAIGAELLQRAAN